jgi:allophanate hydrolase subunit 1
VLAIHDGGRYHHAVELVPAGDAALLVTLRDDLDAQALHAAAAAAHAVSGVRAVVPGHSSLYVIGTPRRDALFDALRNAPPAAMLGTTRTIRVAFDGQDLDEFLRLTKQSRASFLRKVDGLRLTARYLGFRGGFAYLDGWPPEWSMPRRATSRPVARGSFAIAGSVAGFYPIDSPGGWNLLGRTDADLEHALAAGDVLVIEVVDAVSTPPPRMPAAQQIEGVELTSAPLASVVHARDWRNLERGLPAGGPFDDLLASHFATLPLLECPLVWPRLRSAREVWSCGPDLRVRRGVPEGRVEGGLRGYVGFDEPSGGAARDERLVIRTMRGPHDAGIDALECEVTPRLDRVGIRLRPLQTLRIDIPADLRSIGMTCGTVQLHPDGSVVVMGPDHPVTGGYLQPMTVMSGETWKLAQLMPGERVTLVAQSP